MFKDFEKMLRKKLEERLDKRNATVTPSVHFNFSEKQPLLHKHSTILP